MRHAKRNVIAPSLVHAAVVEDILPNYRERVAPAAPGLLCACSGPSWIRLYRYGEKLESWLVRLVLSEFVCALPLSPPQTLWWSLVGCGGARSLPTGRAEGHGVSVLSNAHTSSRKSMDEPRDFTECNVPHAKNSPLVNKGSRSTILFQQRCTSGEGCQM